MNIARTVLMAGAMLGLVSLSVAEARQSPSRSKAASAPADGRDAEATLDKARRALDEGKSDAAQQLADAVLTSANKDARNTARALAIRGEARLGQGRPVEAAADLDSALWVKGGLSGRDRELALAARSKAMQTGGIAGAAPAVAAPLPTAPLPTAPAEPAAPRASPPPAPAPSVRTAELPPPRPVSQPPAWNSAVEVAPAPPPVRSVEPRHAAVATATQAPVPASAPVSAPAPLPWSTAPKYKAPAPEPVSDTQRSGSGGGITGFFSNLFGGGQSASGAADRPAETTGTLGSSSPRPPAVSSFAPQRSTPAEPRAPRAAAPPPPVRAATVVVPARPAFAPPPIPSEPPPAAVSDGMYKLQLAAVRSRSEAQAMARQVQTEEATLVGTRNVEIVEDVYGNMGRFYRVRIGPFPEPTQALAVCASLRDRRMDCMVLDR